MSFHTFVCDQIHDMLRQLFSVSRNSLQTSSWFHGSIAHIRSTKFISVDANVEFGVLEQDLFLDHAPRFLGIAFQQMWQGVLLLFVSCTCSMLLFSLPCGLVMFLLMSITFIAFGPPKEKGSSITTQYVVHNDG